MSEEDQYSYILPNFLHVLVRSLWEQMPKWIKHARTILEETLMSEKNEEGAGELSESPDCNVQ